MGIDFESGCCYCYSSSRDSVHEGSSAHQRKGSRDNQKHADAIIVMGRAGGGRWVDALMG